jgi:hypothetical protein
MKSLSLVQKLSRKAKLVKKAASAFGHVDKVDLSEEVMAASPAAYKLLIKVQRKHDRSFGIDFISKEPAIAFKLNSTSLERFDYGVSDFGMKATFPAGLIEATRIRVGDVVEVLEGSAKGKMLKVVANSSSTTLRLEDISSFGALEANIIVRFELSAVKKGFA